MIIYEVNLVIDKSIYSEFQSWLDDHIKEMLQFPGFIKATFLKPVEDAPQDKEKLTVHYELMDKASLINYLNQFATDMRQDGKNRFNDKFSAERRVLEINKVCK